MTAYWLAVFTSLASVATALVGFAGLLTAFRTTGAPLGLRDVIAIRILLIFSLGAVIFALLPMFFVQEKGSWRLCTVLLAAFLLYWPLRSPSWNRDRGVTPRRPVLYWSILVVMGLLGAAMMVAGATGRSGVFTYAVAVGFCLLVAMVSFVSQVFALLPARSDEPSVPGDQ